MDYQKYMNTRIQSVQPSGIRKFFDIANEMKDVISLSIGEPDFQTPWHIRDEGIRSLTKGKTWYSPNRGFADLLNEITKYYERRFGITYSPTKQALVTVGGSEAIDLVLRVLVDEGDEVIIPQPSFVCYHPLTVMAAIMERHDLEEIAKVCIEKDILVLSDEIYSELTYGGRDHVSIASIDGMYERTVVINGFSKSYAMTGWRLGYALGPVELIGQMTKLHQYGIMSAPTTAQYAAIEALRNGDRDVNRMRDEYDMRRRLVVDAFNDMGLTCFEPLGAFYVFPCIKSTGLSSDEFCTRLIMEKHVAVVPGNAFGESGNGFVRVSYSYSLKHLKIALERIREFLEELHHGN